MNIKDLMSRGIIVPNEDYEEDSLDYQYVVADDYILNVTELFENFTPCGLKMEGDNYRFYCVDDDFDTQTKLLVKPTQNFNAQLYKLIEES